ncbi:hypothetical protein FRC18_001915 [Serendipita sp. 400]|nr:hypothetical protein FRC18_001915 [Serendipita sp. 400]
MSQANSGSIGHLGIRGTCSHRSGDILDRQREEEADGSNPRARQKARRLVNKLRDIDT